MMDKSNKTNHLLEFERELQRIRANNGWTITIECRGLWIITVYDKETGEELASTGLTGLSPILQILEMPFNEPPWVG